MYTDIDGNNDYQGNKRIYAKELDGEAHLKKKSFKTVGSVSRITTFPKPFLFLSHIYCGWKSMGRSGAPSGGVGASGVQLAYHRGLSGQRPSRLAHQASTPPPHCPLCPCVTSEASCATPASLPAKLPPPRLLPTHQAQLLAALPRWGLHTGLRPTPLTAKSLRSSPPGPCSWGSGRSFSLA